ncbi:hypothetical protein WG66_011210 [Moniliophthora roreri]|nr:hypothetical protein WG66_011210 [Moniliophthora roreri]
MMHPAFSWTALGARQQYRVTCLIRIFGKLRAKLSNKSAGLVPFGGKSRWTYML